MGDIETNLQNVRARMAAACVRSDRDPASVILVGVSKTKPAEAAREAVAAGLRDLGENRVQEAEGKIPEVPGEVRWHLIGALQSNKAKRAVGLFDVIHSVDRVSLARKLSRHAREADRPIGVFAQVEFVRNVASDSEIFTKAQALVSAILEDHGALRLEGLMTLPPYSPDPEIARGFFRRLRQLRDTIEDRQGVALPGLSMGMSGDFEIAIEEGATAVRVGTTIFGARTATHPAGPTG